MRYVGSTTKRKSNILILFICALFGSQVFAATAQDILKKARQKLETKSDQAHVALKIIEPGGEVKSREMSLQILRTKDGFKSMIRMTSPADVKDTALLAQMEDGQDQEWLYLPSSKQVRRIAGNKKSSGILGSELSAGDLDPMAMSGSSVKLEKQTSSSAAISVKPKKGTSEYTRVVTTFSMPDALPRKTEYYKGTGLEKTVEFLNYKAYEGGIHRASRIHIMNVKKKRGTDIEFSEVSVNPPLVAKDFTPDALKSNW